MTIGPDPKRSIFLRSFRAGILPLLFYIFKKLLEEITRIVGTGGGFWMILDRKEISISALHSFQCVVIKIDMGHENLILNSFRFDNKPVVLRCDLNLLCQFVEDRMISAMVTKMKFSGSPPHSES